MDLEKYCKFRDLLEQFHRKVASLKIRKEIKSARSIRKGGCALYIQTGKCWYEAVK